MTMPDLETGFFVRLNVQDKKTLSDWGVEEIRSMTGQATAVLQKAIEEYRKNLA